jgi:hypothetical protein
MTLKTEHFEKRYIDRDSILLDSACFNHIFNSKKWFIDYKDIETISTGASNGGTGAVVGRGTVRISLLLPSGQTHFLEMPNTLYQPAAPCNLLSAGHLERNGVIPDGFNKTICFKDSKQILGYYTTIDSVFVMATNTALQQPALASIKHSKVDYATMHRRLLHCSHDKLIAVAKTMLISYSPKEYADFDCEACHAAKAKAQISRFTAPPAQFPLHEIQADTIHHSKLGVHSFKYSTHMLDACTGHHWIVFSRNMRDVAEKVVNWGNEIENLTGRSIHEFFIDGGKEFLRINQWASEKGIQIRNTPPDTPEPRGRIERAGGVFTTMSRTAMIDADLPSSLWPYAEAWAVKILNLLPTSANENDEPPHSKLSRLLGLHQDLLNPYVLHIRVFGAMAWLLLKGAKAPAQGNKTAPRAIKGRYLGSASRKGHVVYVWIPSVHRITTARDVAIVEKFPDDESVEEPEYLAQWESESEADDDSTQISVKHKSHTKKHTEQAKTLETTLQDIEPELEESLFVTPPATPSAQSAGELPSLPDNQQTQAVEADIEGFLADLNQDDVDDLNSEQPAIQQPAFAPSIRRLAVQQPVLPAPVQPTPATSPRRSRRSTAQHDYKALNSGKASKKPTMVTLSSERIVLQTILALSTLKANDSLQRKVPKSYFEAKKGPNWMDWKPAFEKQIKDLDSRHTWDLVYPPPDTTVLPGRWVLDMKYNAQGEWDRNRARWVVCGNFENSESWAAQDVYAAVVNSASVKLFFTFVAVLNLECYQYDVVTAFLNAQCKGDPIYVEQPHGFTDGTKRVCQLNRALYGLRKAPLWWFETICAALKKHGFEPMTSDLCLFKNDKLSALLLLYVDDILVAAPQIDGIQQIKDILLSYYELKEFGEVQEFLGISIVRNRQKSQIFLHQKGFTERILERFGYSDLNAVTTPWNSTYHLPIEWEKVPEAAELYSQQTGSTNYLSCHTRPDITYTSNKLAGGNSGPSPAHWKALQHLFRYLVGTKELGILLGGQYTLENLDLKAYCDAAFADDIHTRYSTAGHVIFVAGGPIYWVSKKQTLVTLSTTEAEFINLTPTACSLIWIKTLLKELGYADESPKLIFTDSANALAIALNPFERQRTRHIDIRYKWIIDRVRKHEFELQHVDTGRQTADGFTKGLLKEKHQAFVRQLNMITLSEFRTLLFY